MGIPEGFKLTQNITQKDIATNIQILDKEDARIKRQEQARKRRTKILKDSGLTQAQAEAQAEKEEFDAATKIVEQYPPEEQEQRDLAA